MLIKTVTHGQVVTAFAVVDDEILQQSIRVRNVPLAKLFAAKLELISRANDAWSFEAVVERARFELDAAWHAQARRRFRSSFGAGTP